MNWLNNALDTANGFLYTYVLLFLLAGVGFYFSFKTRFVQFRLLGTGIKTITERKKQESGISSFQAMMISTASRVGTGNIVGVATAVGVGGPGSVFWMWLIAVIGGASAFIESVLAQVYKVRDGGLFRGGPAYYIEQATGKRQLASLFSVLLIICTAIGWNSLTAYNIGSGFEYYIANYNDSSAPLIVGAACAALLGLVIFGGVRRIGFVSSIMVPIMASIYIFMAIAAIIMHIDRVPAMFSMIFQDAFDLRKIMGGFAGSCVVFGVKRGLFSNEAGMGTGANAAATADVAHPVSQGLVQSISVFIDTLLICSATAMFLLLSNADSVKLKGTPYIQAAVSDLFGVFGIHFMTVSLFLFAFTTLIGNYFYAETNLKFLNDNPKLVNIFRILQLVIVFLGAQMGFDLAWNLADFTMCLVTVVNLVAMLWLAKTALKVLNDFDEQKKAGKEPVFKAANVGLTNTEWWK